MTDTLIDDYCLCGDHRIHFKVWGDQSEALILVHGWGSSVTHSWETTGWIENLLPYRRVVALDVLGHGLSDKPYDQALYGYRPLSRNVLAVMDHLNIPKADLLGYSMGALMGEALLLDAPTRFSSMILGGIGDEAPSVNHDAQIIAEAMRAENADDIIDPMGQAYRAYINAIPEADLEAMALSALQMWPETFPLQFGGKALAEVQTPVLVINGSDDPYAVTAPAFATALPNGKLEEISECDHLTLMTDERFMNRAINFLKGQK